MSAATAAAARPAALVDRARRSSVATAIGAGVTGSSWGLATAALVVPLAGGLPLFDDVFMSLYLVNAVVWGGASGLLIARRPTLLGAILASMSIGSGLTALVVQLLRLPDAGGLDPGIALHPLDRLWLPGTLAGFAVAPLLATTRRLSMGTKALVGLGLVAAVTPFLVSFVRQRPGLTANPFAIQDPTVQEALGVVVLACFAISIALAVVTDAVLIWRWRRGPVEERRGAAWLAVGQSFLVVFFSPIFAPWAPESGVLLTQYAPLAPTLSLVLMVAAVIVSSLGPDLRGIDVVVNRVVLEVVLFAVLVLLYASIALPLMTALPVPPIVAGIAGVAALALSVDPARRWVQRRVDALVYGDAADPAQLLSRLGSRPVESGSGELESLVAELRQTLHLGSLEVRCDDPDGVLVSSGSGGGPEATLPLRSADGVIGWVAARSSGRQRVDRRTRRLLERISGVLAVALQFDSVNRHVAEVRDRALGAGEDERRMVRRELQDGLAPALEQAAAGLDGVPALLADDPDRARAEVEEVRRSLAERTAEIRDLARTLVPGALEAGDLDTALAELAQRFSGSRITFAAASSGASELDPTRQAALYHLASEAVLMIRRTAGARHAVIRLTVEDARAVLQLECDGAFELERAGSALASITDRARELGGDVHVSAARDELRIEIPR